MLLEKISLGSVKIEKLLVSVSWLVTLGVTLMIVVDIIMRFLFKHPLPASWEICELMMPWIVFTAFAYTLTIDAHVRVSLLIGIVSPAVRRVMLILSELVSLIICALITYFATIHFLESFIIREEMMAAIPLPWWLGKMAMPIGMLFLTIRYLFLVLDHIRGKDIKAKESVGV
ncbi:MAG: Tripartite ATP-independent periplasmic transporter [Smithella sp. PtaU1.Bin162]|nr:MAG: Tripartite ATP-independent periplasmic transporter [Smithella sp. PtaU1.Bin162]